MTPRSLGCVLREAALVLRDRGLDEHREFEAATAVEPGVVGDRRVFDRHQARVFDRHRAPA